MVPSKSDFFIIIIVYLILILPVLFLENPGFYGDDFSFLKQYNDGSYFYSYYDDMVFGAGYSHRPLGWFLLLTFYTVFGWSELFAYLGSITLFVSMIFLAQIFLRKLFDNDIFVTSSIIFFSFFPFSATAYYQIPSSYMLATYILLFIYLYYFIFYNDFSSIYKNIIFSFSWFLILLCYESSIGVTIAMPFILLFKNISNGNRFKLNEYLKLFLIIGLPSIIFIILYFTDSSNIKILSMDLLVEEDIKTNQEVSLINNFSTEINYKIYDFYEKLIRTTLFLLESLFYLQLNSNRVWLPLTLIYTLSLLIIIFLFKKKYFVLNANSNYLLMLIGISWSIGAILPFLLYPGFTIPTYHLMLPSFGIGIFLYSFFGILFRNYSIVIYKYIVSIIFLLFVSIQFSYFISLNEELRYWENIAQKTNVIIKNTKDDQIIRIIDLPQKYNFHVFWLEEAVGRKHFRNNMFFKYNIDVDDYSIYTDTKSKVMNIDIFPNEHEKKVMILNFKEL